MGAIGIEANDLFEDEGRKESASKRVVATYEYRDEQGALLVAVDRLQPKGFRQRRPDGLGGWAHDAKGVRRTLYRLPELQGQRSVFVVEGEKDADRLVAEGVAATTNAGGAGKWRDDYVEQLKSAGVERIFVIPDNDDCGRRHAQHVVESCRQGGLRAVSVTLPGVHPKGDVSDFLDAGHSIDTLKRLAEHAPEEQDQTRLRLTRLSDFMAEPEDARPWVWSRRIRRGGLAVLAGKPKAGKSTAARDLALAVARGESWLGCDTTAGAVWYLALEEHPDDVRAHFRRMGAVDEDIFVCWGNEPDLLARLKAQVAVSAPTLIIVDTMQRLIRVRDANDYSQVTTGLQPLLNLARESGAAILLLHHCRKGEALNDPQDSVLGSTAIAGSVDTTLFLARTEKFRVMSSRQRTGGDMEETVLTIDETTGRVVEGPKRLEAELIDLGPSILRVLESSGPLAEPDVMDAVEGRTKVKRAALRRLVGAGAVSREGAGRRGEPYMYASNSRSLVPSPGTERGNEYSAQDRDSREAATGYEGDESADVLRIRAERVDEAGSQSGPAA